MIRALADPAATHAWGRELGSAAQPGAVYALTGTLGAGKTALTQGVAEGWGVTALGEVVSPTYAIMFDHPAPRGRLVHIDLYRLDGLESVLGLGVEEAISDRSALVIIEWADRIPELIPEHATWIALNDDDAGGRIARVSGRGFD
ncbi:MAG: tRNA (adenosine(37)-N6)-threonylcarbamoyltransferase complex ATPase subunit type 1 TsaE [Myxococcota bacterium]